MYLSSKRTLSLTSLSQLPLKSKKTEHTKEIGEEREEGGEKIGGPRKEHVR